MEDKNKFLQLLEDIKDFAAVNNRIIDQVTVKEFFEEEITQDQLEMVYAYLESNEITVQGHKSAEHDVELFRISQEEAALPQEERAEEQKPVEEEQYLEQYINELSMTEPLSEEEKTILFKKIGEKDALAKSRLIEGMLGFVVELAKEYKNRGLLLSDLIQEGNIGLMLAVEELGELEPENTGMAYLEQKIRLSMKEAIAENNEIRKAADDVLIKSNVIHEGAKNLAEELERGITIEELAKYLQMQENEIEDILQISKDHLPINKTGNQIKND